MSGWPVPRSQSAEVVQRLDQYLLAAVDGGLAILPPFALWESRTIGPHILAVLEAHRAAILLPLRTVTLQGLWRRHQEGAFGTACCILSLSQPADGLPDGQERHRSLISPWGGAPLCHLGTTDVLSAREAHRLALQATELQHDC
jgi:hypothetical protein